MNTHTFPDMLKEIAPTSEVHIIAGKNHSTIQHSSTFVEALAAWLKSSDTLAS